jgi:dihydropteroate synthase
MTMVKPNLAAMAQQHAIRALLAQSLPSVMGVLNVTPDSFSDGGKFLAPQTALDRAKLMIAEGAAILDIGAESTRPYGSQPVSADEEMQRLQTILPDVIALGIPVSIDTMKRSPTTSGACNAIRKWRL